MQTHIYMYTQTQRPETKNFKYNTGFHDSTSQGWRFTLAHHGIQMFPGISYASASTLPNLLSIYLSPKFLNAMMSVSIIFN